MGTQTATTEPPAPGPTAEVRADLAAACADLERLQELFDDACQSLMDSFHDVSVDLTQLQDQLDEPVYRRLHQHLNGAITGMQFQDLANQLIAHTLGRLQQCSRSISRGPEAAASPGSAARSNPVRQRTMVPGSIDLF